MSSIQLSHTGAKLSDTREHCEYSLEGLRQTVPKASASVEQKTICGFFNRSMRILKAYRDGLQYGCAELKNRVYKSHRRIEDKSKWQSFCCQALPRSLTCNHSCLLIHIKVVRHCSGAHQKCPHFEGLYLPSTTINFLDFKYGL